MCLKIDSEDKEMRRFFDRCGLEILWMKQENNEKHYLIRKKKE